MVRMNAPTTVPARPPRPPNRPRAADHRRGNRGEDVVLADGRRTGPGLRGEVEARERRKQTRKAVGRGIDPDDRSAGQICRTFARPRRLDRVFPPRDTRNQSQKTASTTSIHAAKQKPRKLPLPIAIHPPGRLPPSVGRIRSATPDRIDHVASVTRNGCSRRTEISTPFNAPAAGADQQDEGKPECRRSLPSYRTASPPAPSTN